jgi:ATP-dependent Clp protease ATP-binding subunit ClpX
MEGVGLTFTEDALSVGGPQGDRPQDRRRGLRSIMEGILLDTMFDLPTYQGVEEVVINAEVVEGRAQPLMIYAERRENPGAA